MKKLALIILAAGYSKRMKSSTSKIFHKLAEKSMIDYVYETANLINPYKIIIVCNKKNINHVSKLFPKSKTVLQKKQNGTGDAVLCAYEALSDSKDVLILFGDVPLIEHKTVKQLIKKYKLSKSTGSLLTFKTTNTTGYGRVETNKGFIKRIIEDVETTKENKIIKLCNSGIMISNKNFLFDCLRKVRSDNIKKEKFITDVYEIAYNQKKPFNYTICDQRELIGANTRLDLIKLDKILQNKLKDKLIESGVTILQPETVRVSFDTKIGKDSIIEPNVVIKKGVKISKNVIIKSNSVLENSIIGAGSVIGPSAHIRPFCKIFKNVKIGNFVEIKNSIVNQGTKISHLSYIGDSKIGRNVNIGAGTITCNYDGNKKSVTVINDNAFIGSNTSLIAPLKIGANSVIGAGSVITKNVPSNSLAIERNIQKNLSKKQKSK